MSLPPAFTDALDDALSFVYSLQVYFDPTVVLVPGSLQQMSKDLAEQIGFDVPTLNYTLGFFLCYPLGMIMNALPYGQVRHLFSFLLGAFLLQFTLGVQWIHQLITSLVAYAMFLILPRKVNTFLIPIFVMGYCVGGHLHRQYINYLGWDLDFTGPQMVITQKLWMMAYNLHDAQELEEGKATRAAKKCAPFALSKLPNLIEFLGYTFCFANVLAGPAYEFSIYAKTCDGSLLYFPDGKPRGKIPSNVWPTLRPFFISLGCLVVYVTLGSQFPILDPTDPQKNTPYILTDEFLARPFVERYFYVWFALLVAVRTKYYFGWMNSEGANNIWYAGFDGFSEDGKPLGWENSSNMNIWGFETAPNFSIMSKEWNKKTSLWLTRYVYYRTEGSLLAVYACSAFWHGFYPGYYMFFLSVPLLQFCERLVKKKISPFFPPEKWTPYGVASILTTTLTVSYMVTAFIMLGGERCWETWKSFFFFGHIGAIVCYIALVMMPSPKKEKKA